MKVNTSAKGRRFIQEHEGLRQRAYQLPGETHWTAGYGHYGSDVKPGVTYSIAQCRAWLREDLGECEAAVRLIFDGREIDVKQQEIDALVSGAFNMGTGWLLDHGYSTLARRLASPEAKTFTGRCRIYREEMPKWVYGEAGRLEGLVQRRKDEVRLACKGRY